MQQKILLSLFLISVTIVFMAVYWATESGRQEAARERLKTEAIIRGAEVYTTACALCHGAAGEGGVGPALKGTALDENALMKAITRGVAGTAMRPWGDEDGGPLKRHQIEDLVTFIRNWNQSLLEAATISAPAPPSPTPAPPALSPVNASGLFTAKCGACHGINRQGVPGLGSALTPESLAKLNDAQIKDIILNGRPNTAMPAWKNILSPEEIEHLIQLIKYTSP